MVLGHALIMQRYDMRIADVSLLCQIILLLWHDIQLNDMISQYIFVINPFSAGTLQTSDSESESDVWKRPPH